MEWLRITVTIAIIIASSSIIWARLNWKVEAIAATTQICEESNKHHDKINKRQDNDLIKIQSKVDETHRNVNYIVSRVDKIIDNLAKLNGTH